MELRCLTSVKDSPYGEVPDRRVKLPKPTELEVLLYEVGLEKLAPYFRVEEIDSIDAVKQLELEGLKLIGVPCGPALTLLQAVETQHDQICRLTDRFARSTVMTTKGEMDVDAIVKEVISGRGWIVIPSIIPKALLAQAKK